MIFNYLTDIFIKSANIMLQAVVLYNGKGFQISKKVDHAVNN